MAEPIPVAVVGAGHWGRLHAAKYAALPEARLVAVVDPDRERAERAAGGDGTVAVLADVAELAGRGVRAASVAVPTTLHHAVACRLLDLGVDLLVEKPITSTVAEADDLLARARAAGRTIQVGHLERFNPTVEALAGRIERPLFVEAQRLGAFSARALDVDVVLDLMIHDLDLLLHWIGRPVRFVHAVGVAVLSPNVDIANARLEFEGGAVANLTASRVSAEKTRKIRVFQASGYLSVDLAQRRVAALRRDPQDGILTPDAVDVPEADALERELRSFVSAIRDGRTPVVTGEDGREALALAARILAAMAEHRTRVEGA